MSKPYPHIPWYKKAGTSADAAKSMEGAAPRLRDQVLEKVKGALVGLTTDECANALKLSILSIRPRFSELKELGLIEETGERRRNGSGRIATVWKACVPVAKSA